MYSIVMMMALSSGGDVAQAGLFRHGCHGDCGGGYGCSGAVYGCSGGWGCSGGDGCHGGRHRLFGHRGHGCHGGYACCGSYGGYGCSGGWGGYGCHGGYGMGYGCTGGYGGWGGYGCMGSAYMGGYPGCVGGGYVVPSGPAMTTPAAPERRPKGGTREGGTRETTPPPRPREGTQLSAPATIVVSLPAEAKLSVDGVATQSTSATRVFATPALEQGNEYYYTLTAELARDGKTVTASKRITVRAGEETRVSLEFPLERVAQR